VHPLVIDLRAELDQFAVELPGLDPGRDRAPLAIGLHDGRPNAAVIRPVVTDGHEHAAGGPHREGQHRPLVTVAAHQGHPVARP
jgi:hypothetical protein